MTNLKPCPSCGEPLDHPSGDGCANMTAHKEKAVGDEELIARLRDVTGEKLLYTNTPNHLRLSAADRIEALTAEREKLGREVNMARYGQPDFAWSFHKEAMADLEAKLAKAVELLRKHCDTWAMNDFDAATLAEIKGESHE